LVEEDQSIKTTINVVKTLKKQINLKEYLFLLKEPI